MFLNKDYTFMSYIKLYQQKTPTNTLEACVHTDDKACECPCCSRSQHFNYCQNSFSGIR